MTRRADDLLSGPRGRRVCLEVVLDAVGGDWRRLVWTRGSGGRYDPEQTRRSLAASIAALDLAAVRATARPDDWMPALLAAVDAARYWQEPGDEDRALAGPAMAAVLAPLAAAVARAPASQWWAEPMAADDQHAVAFRDDDEATPGAPLLTGAGPALREWREQAAAEEDRARRERPADPRADWSGEWWSTPALTGRVVTTRSLPGTTPAEPRAPVRLPLVEDGMGWTTARSWPVHVPGDACVLELTGPADWVALIERYPREVTASRRHDWWRVAGWDGTWVVPDWAAVAEDVDGVHLTVDGYLSTAGRALPVDVPALAGPARTLLAGWDPDATWWLTDAPAGLGAATDWRRRDEAPYSTWVAAGA
ncbi:hypothetical protein SAMN06893096_103216 [Geodermatophilus pulveris]|uniref:Uncharacterized protein n=1 Tax=Geodermatophilus pulveris TaxID=1564159 RepID=A0A239DJA3_9ACTN|nr:hypothetical protein [Geodermatophilus pulveris]SNS32319.1 hypothetical protein SAMN06893096_103216 [Geodermatophilus pulveris]